MTKKRKAASPLQAGSPSANADITLETKMEQKIGQLHQQLLILQQRVDQLEMENDGLQQSARLNCLLFSGPAVPERSCGEEAAELVRNLLLQHLDYRLDRTQIKTAFRMGARIIMVEFLSGDSGSDRDNLFRMKTSLRGSGMFISESLTQRRRHILRNILELKKSRKVFTVFTQSGDIFVRETASSPPVRVADMSAVQRLHSGDLSNISARKPGVSCIAAVAEKFH